MKELHNNIFSNTTCISKEIMLRYINKQLSKNELYEVEKHMLDCELCSEAYEGMAFAQNSSILFAIDNEIDQRIAKGKVRAPIMKDLIVAASVLVIIFGAYFTFNYFNNTVENELGLAVNEVEEFEQEMEPVTETIVTKEEKNNNQKNLEFTKQKKGDIAIVEERIENQKYRASVNIPNPIPVEEELEDMISLDEEEEIELAEEKVVLSNNLTGEKSKGEGEKTVIVKDNFIRNEMDKKAEELKKELKNKSRSKASKKKFKSFAEAPSMVEEANVEQQMNFDDAKEDRTVTINSFKVVDYVDQYQQEYDLNKAAKIEKQSVSADFESKQDKDVADKEMDELVVEITYKETLEKAMKFYKSKEYRKALSEYDMILAKHPKEVNAQFYMGLCYYHLKKYGNAIKKFDSVLKNKQTEFNEEANWYKALTLIEMKSTTSAKKILNNIIKKDGFYKVKAENKLKEL